MAKYAFVNPEHTRIRRLSDGAEFTIERHEHPSNVGGAIAEQWRNDGCPAPEPYAEPVKAPDDQARARRRTEGTDRRVAR